jgi:hypothetical protein
MGEKWTVSSGKNYNAYLASSFWLPNEATKKRKQKDSNLLWFNTM